MEPNRVADVLAPPSVLPFTPADIERSVAARFDQVARHFPDQTALTGSGRRWTYRELAARTSRLAHAIRGRVGPGGGRVAYLCDLSPEMVIATLAVLKAGKTYLAIHPGAPPARQVEILTDVEPALLLSTAAMRGRAMELAAGVCPVLVLDDVEEGQPDEGPEINTGPGDPSTVFYTSGTTGRPKGVLKSHRAVMHRVWLAVQHDGVGPGDRVSLLTHCAFSASESDMFGALLNGATLSVFDFASEGLTPFHQWLLAERITLLHPPVLLFRRFLAGLDPGDRFPLVRLVALAGDKVLASDIVAWRRHFPAPAVLMHRFSTTETGLLCVARIESGAGDGDDLLAGRPVEGKLLTLIGPGGEPVGVGDEGELVVRSRYIADGYWRRPSEAFQPDAAVAGQRVYRTGDRGCFRPDGTFVFVGRGDRQVKIRGFRVELGEVEAAIQALAGVREVAVVARDHAGGDKQLVAFVVPGGDPPPIASGLRLALADALPHYMVPGAIVLLDSLPVTATGKVDRQALPAVDGSSETTPPPTETADPVEQELISIWKEVLGRDQVRAEDNFFDLGGHSLQAAQAFAKMEQRLRVQLPLGILLQAPTVRALARVIRERVESGPWRSLVAIQPTGRRTPVFALPGLGGNVVGYHDLARLLGPDQPFYGLQSRGLDGTLSPLTTIEAIAAAHLAEVREVQSAGPYLLVGACMGGTVAYEMAQQLRAAGEGVRLLVLIETPAPTGPAADRPVARPMGPFRFVLGRLRLYASTLASLRGRERTDYLLGRFRTIMRVIGRRNLFPGGRGEFLSQMVTEANRAALRRYQPRPYPGPVVHIRAEGHQVEVGDDRRNGWQGLVTGGLEVFDAPGGDSGLMLVPPNVDSLARRLRSVFDLDPGHLTTPSSLAAQVRKHAERNPDAIVVAAPGRDPLTYRELDRHIADVVQFLNATGIGRGDRVAMVLPDGPELATAFVGISAAATCAPLNPVGSALEYEAQFHQLRPRALVAPRASASPAVAVALVQGIPVIELEPVQGHAAGRFTLALRPGQAVTPDLGSAGPAGWAGPDDVALVLHTSGTAARPKLVPLTHRNLCAAADGIRQAVELSEHDRCLSVMPLFHIHGLSAITASLAAGASVICPERFSASGFFEMLGACRPTWYTAAPTLHREILDYGRRHRVAAAGSSLRFIRSASAPMPAPLIAALVEMFGVPFVEAYGLTEAAPQVASNGIRDDQRRGGSVGRPIGAEVAIAGEDGGFLAAGATGEITVRGPGVMVGYEDDPGANAEAFVGGWFRTGDLGFVDRDGFLFVTGRTKEIVNRGGEKISPREVEQVLVDHPAVAEVVVFPVPHPTLGEDVAAAIVARPGSSGETAELEREIRRFALTRLAAFKVPQRVVIVDRIPSGTTGKVRRLDLAAQLGLLGPTETAGFTAARTPEEIGLAAIWAEILDGAPVSVRANFFQIGGDSLKAAQVLARVARDFGIELAPLAMYEHPTVEELARLLKRDDSVGGDRTVIERRFDGGPASLSLAQQRLWVLDQFDPGNPAYNMHVALRLSGRLDEPALERSLTEIVDRHEALRTTFPSVDGQAVQRVAPPRPVRLPVVDLMRMPEPEREAEAARLAAEEACRPFHLSRGPLFRVMLLKLTATEHLLVMAMHHIVSDGWSTGVLCRELATLYPAITTGLAPELATLPIQYGDFAAWQRQHLHGEALAGQRAYWKKRLDGMPPLLELPIDRPRSARPSHRGASVVRTLPGSLLRDLDRVGTAENATAFMTLLAAFQAVLHRYSGQVDLGVGVPIAGRTRVETEGLIGFFANTLVMRADLSGDPSFRELVARTRVSAIAAYAHQDLPFELLVDELQPERTGRHNPLFQVMFAFQNVPVAAPAASWGGLAVTPFEIANDSAKFDLTLYLSPAPDGLALTWQYSTDLFDRSTVAGMADVFLALLTRAVARPDAPLSSLALVADGQPRESSDGGGAWLPATSDGPGFHHRFETQAERTPHAVAVRYGEEQVTYAELNARANRLAAELIGLGVGPGSRVGLLLGRSVGMIVGVLGVLKAGGAWVPLDPAYPLRHLEFVRADAELGVLVTDDDSLAVAEAAFEGVRRVMVPAGGSGDLPNPAGRVRPSDLAYVIYTSGSTGRSKGVMITHGNLSHYVDAMRAAIGIGEDDCWLHTASFAFSSSVRQFAVPLACGASVEIAPTEAIRSPRALFRLIADRGATVLDIVPSYWRAVNQVLDGLEPAERDRLLTNRLRALLSASEPLPVAVVREWRSFGHPARLINMFGQTETTGIVTVHPISAAEDEVGPVVPIGRPIAGTRIHVLDGAGHPVPAGVWGELYVGGPGVGLGYLNAGTLTAERFGPDRFGDEAGRLYRTGDLARVRTDGTIEFRGRADQQLKLHGYRIEPGQIEAVAIEHPGCRECAVVVRDEADGERRLVAWVVPAPGASLSVAGLREHWKGMLPGYMVPAVVVVAEALPKTPNGKLDRVALARGEVPAPAPHPSAPATPDSVEATLLALWAAVLGVERVGVDDNFFDLGGNSILSIGMIEKANAAGLAITPRMLWEHQTVAELARACAGGAAPKSVATKVFVTMESLRAWGREALERAGLAPEGAAIVTEVQLEASLRDQPTHNMVSIPRYARRIAAGTINPRPDIRVERATDTSAHIDGDNGPGQWVAVVAMETAIRIAREKGVGVVGVRRSNHLGAAGHYPWMAARQGLIGLCTTNGPVILAPTGGITPTFGNNPLGVGIPAGRHHPIILDIAMSVAPRGRIGLQLAEGKPLPAGWILDRHGRPSVDPADLVAGLGVPIGGHKGYGLTLVMEVLAGVLTGAGFGWDNRRADGPRAEKPANFGHFFMAIDPELFLPIGDFTARVDRMIEQAKTGALAHGSSEILVPGEAEMKARERSLESGVPLRMSTWEALQTYGRKARLATPLVRVG